MVKYLWLIGCGVLLLASCARPPVMQMEKARVAVAQAYAAGASRLAEPEYNTASEALMRAEQLYQKGAYREAELALHVAQRYSSKALGLTNERKRLIAEEQARKAAEEARAAAERARLEELERLSAEPAKEEVPPPADKPEPPPKPVLVKEVKVQEEETLASISARKEVYLDPLLWPLIYKANRDQIKDPTEIFPGQVLQIPRDKTEEELEAAREEARELDLF